VTLSHLKLFRDLASFRSFSKAALANRVSQSAASQQVQELERQFGIPLVDRSTRPLSLTRAGDLYLNMCQDILLRRDQFEAELSELRERTEGLVRVAAIYSVGLGELSRLEDDFRDRYPKADLQIQFLRPEKIEQAIRDDQADLGLISYPVATEELHVSPWREEEMVVAVGPRHPLARRKQILPFDLNGKDFVAFDEDLPIRRAIDRYLTEQMVEVNVVLHFDNIAHIKEAVAHGSGLSIVPRPIVDVDVLAGRLVALPLGPPHLIRPLGILYRRRKRLSKAAQAFLRLLEESEEMLALPAS
jgi:LysR family transcriptional regulator, transcriptional activator of the cysJI operon